MPTFLDESGSFGWDENTTTHFTIAAVWFETSEFAYQCDRTIAGVRKTLGLLPKFEFKFRKNNNFQRMEFLKAVSDCSFHYAICTLEKKRNGRWLEGKMWRNREYFYEKVVAPLVACLEGFYRIAEACKGGRLNEAVVFDQHTDPFYREALRQHFFRPKGPDGRSFVKKIRPGKSESNSLIQLADMISGSFAYSSQSDSYIELLKGKKLAHVILP